MKTNRTSLRRACCLVLPGLALTLAGCAGVNSHHRTAGEYIDDDVLISRVAAAFSKDPEYKFEDVSIASHQGTVRLSGYVPTGDEKTEAENITERVRGVKEVENNINVTP